MSSSGFYNSRSFVGRTLSTCSRQFLTNVKETVSNGEPYSRVGPLRRRATRRGPPRRRPQPRPRLQSDRQYREDSWSLQDTAQGTLDIQTSGWKPLSSDQESLQEERIWSSNNRSVLWVSPLLISDYWNATPHSEPYSSRNSSSNPTQSDLKLIPCTVPRLFHFPWPGLTYTSLLSCSWIFSIKSHEFATEIDSLETRRWFHVAPNYIPMNEKGQYKLLCIFIKQKKISFKKLILR